MLPMQFMSTQRPAAVRALSHEFPRKGAIQFPYMHGFRGMRGVQLTGTLDSSLRPLLVQPAIYFGGGLSEYRGATVRVLDERRRQVWVSGLVELEAPYASVRISEEDLDAGGRHVPPFKTLNQLRQEDLEAFMETRGFLNLDRTVQISYSGGGGFTQFNVREYLNVAYPHVLAAMRATRTS